MKTENDVKKILGRALMGFPLGVMVLMIGYVGIYLIAGESTFIKEMEQLQNINILVMQMISASIAYSIILSSLLTGFSVLTEFTVNRSIASHPNKTITIYLLTELLPIFLSLLILSNSKIFSESICIMNISICLICYAVISILFIAKSFKESALVKKINQKLKERNSN